VNALPVVTISHHDGGHRVLCTCGWLGFRFTRIAADLIATEHRASHGRNQP
jgi:hypothetical protein